MSFMHLMLPFILALHYCYNIFFLKGPLTLSELVNLCCWSSNQLWSFKTRRMQKWSLLIMYFPIIELLCSGSQNNLLLFLSEILSTTSWLWWMSGWREHGWVVGYNDAESLDVLYSSSWPSLYSWTTCCSPLSVRTLHTHTNLMQLSIAWWNNNNQRQKQRFFCTNGAFARQARLHSTDLV